MTLHDSSNGPRAELRRRTKSDGYAMLLILFFVALLAISVGGAATKVMVEARREKEEEMIWRGKQYVRGIRLYYQKTHRLPTQLEDLYKPKSGIRFMRQAYKDPMNGVDGSWRLISVGPNGQLLGSLKEHRNAYFFGSPAQPGFGGALTASTSAPKSLFSSASSFGGPASTATPGTAASQVSAPPNDTSGSTNPADSQDAGGPIADALDAGAATGQSPTLGVTAIVGVGSKTNRLSFAKFEGAKNYLQFEFVWDGSATAAGTPSP